MHMEHISGMIMKGHIRIRAFILYLLLPLVIIRTSPSSSSCQSILWIYFYWWRWWRWKVACGPAGWLCRRQKTIVHPPEPELAVSLIGETISLSQFLAAAKPTTLAETNSFFILNEISKEGQNSPAIMVAYVVWVINCRILGQIWPLRLLRGHSGLKTSFSVLVSDWRKFLIFF